MAQSIRPNKKAMQIAYDILNTPKELQQGTKKPSEKVLREWFIDSSSAQ